MITPPPENWSPQRLGINRPQLLAKVLNKPLCLPPNRAYRPEKGLISTKSEVDLALLPAFHTLDMLHQPFHVVVCQNEHVLKPTNDCVTQIKTTQLVVKVLDHSPHPWNPELNGCASARKQEYPQLIALIKNWRLIGPSLSHRDA